MIFEIDSIFKKEDFIPFTLSYNMAKDIPAQYLNNDSGSWWLATTGHERVDYVEPDGNIVKDGAIPLMSLYVKPALLLDVTSKYESIPEGILYKLNKLPKIGDIIKFLGKEWVYVNHRYMLADFTIGSTFFDRFGQTDYIHSHLKSYINSWYENQVKKNKYFAGIFTEKNSKLIDSIESNDIQEITDFIDDWLLSKDNNKKYYAAFKNYHTDKGTIIRAEDLIEK